MPGLSFEGGRIDFLAVGGWLRGSAEGVVDGEELVLRDDGVVDVEGTVCCYGRIAKEGDQSGAEGRDAGGAKGDGTVVEDWKKFLEARVQAERIGRKEQLTFSALSANIQNERHNTKSPI